MVVVNQYVGTVPSTFQSLYFRAALAVTAIVDGRNPAPQHV